MTKREISLVIKTRFVMVKEMDLIKKKTSQFTTIKTLCKFYRVSPKTFYKWSNRFFESGQDSNSLLNKKSSPLKTRRLSKIFERMIICLRDKLQWSTLRIHIEFKKRGVLNPDSGKPISESCIRAVFDRYRRGYQHDKLRQRLHIPDVVRYEKDLPGELGHIDIKKLKNIKGEDPQKKKYQYALTDDCTRIPYVEILSDKTMSTAAGFLKRAVQWFKEKFDIVFERILSDNGKEFTYHTERGREFHKFEITLRKLEIKHSYTKIRRPQTNGKVERFFKTLDMEIYKRIIFLSAKHRNFELKRYLKIFIYYRPHMGIEGLTPYEKFVKATKQFQKGGVVVKGVA